jgi:hypothetical protein
VKHSDESRFCGSCHEKTKPTYIYAENGTEKRKTEVEESRRENQTGCSTVKQVPEIPMEKKTGHQKGNPKNL